MENLGILKTRSKEGGEGSSSLNNAFWYLTPNIYLNCSGYNKGF